MDAVRKRFAQEGNIKFYSDGSLTNVGTEAVSAAFGVIASVEGGGLSEAISGRVEGFASSANAELCGLLATVIISPRDKAVDIYLDNSSVVDGFHCLVEKRAQATTRQKLRSADAQWWAMVHDAYQRQGRGIKVHWVRGHAGNQGNEKADKLAKAAHERYQVSWRLQVDQHQDMWCHAQFALTSADKDMREILKLQSAVRHHHKWLSQNRTKEYVQDWTEVAWAPTLGILHDKNPPMGLFTSVRDCQLRAHRVKKLHGMLPTLSQMRQR
ncbi:hypothetical protein BGX34_002862, partial [Mortierella sp. NVP85]